jgi:hypothetical protein
LGKRAERGGHGRESRPELRGAAGKAELTSGAALSDTERGNRRERTQARAGRARVRLECLSGGPVLSASRKKEARDAGQAGKRADRGNWAAQAGGERQACGVGRVCVEDAGPSGEEAGSARGGNKRGLGLLWAGIWDLGCYGFGFWVLFFLFYSFLNLIQTKFEFKFEFEFKPHSIKIMHQHECNQKFKPRINFN